MKKDIDKLMKKMKIDALLVEGKSSKDAIMYYLLDGVNIVAWYVKKRGQSPVVIHAPIEREVAQQSGYKLISLNRYETRKIYEKYQDNIKASAYFIKMVFNDLKVSGNVAFYGNMSMGAGYGILRQLAKFDKKIKIHYDSGKDLITTARETKDSNEILKMKKVGRGLTSAFDSLLKTVQQMKVKRTAIMKDNKRKLLIGDLKVMLQKALFDNGLICPAGMIVAQGRDAGVPHNAGRDREVVKLGKTIVFDIFPQRIGGGYFFDFTRTVCFGYAPKKIAEAYKIVKDGQDHVIDILKVGKRNFKIEVSLCKFFEDRGHSTLLSSPKTYSGYCHTLGHGVGLNVHESPSFGLLKTNKDRIKPGHVFTVEPGLYYPDDDYGIRLEDIVYINKSGKPINLTNYARKLVVEM